MAMGTEVRQGGLEDAGTAARLLHDFNEEFGEPTPGIEALRGRVVRLLGEGSGAVLLLVGGGPDGIALVRFRGGLWSEGPETYLQELYVVPARRGNGLGRALLEATIALAREAGSSGVELNTGETDAAARSLYESAGFTNREGSPDGPSMLFYELEFE